MTFAIYVQKSQVHNVCDMVVVDLQMSIFIDFFIINEKIEKNIKKQMPPYPILNGPT
jgi:hypothetical protein